jgi:hypothetical protein
MPGWVRSSSPAVDDSDTDSTGWQHSDGPGEGEGARTQNSVPPVSPPAIQMTPLAKSGMTQSQRDELIAEILGDVVTLSDQVSQVSVQVQALGQALTANDFVRWRNTLDMKMSELADVNLSEQSAKRLQSFAQAYIEQLSRETNTLVTIETKRAVANTMTFNVLFDKLNRDWLIRLSSMFAVCCIGTIVGQMVWSIL